MRMFFNFVYILFIIANALDAKRFYDFDRGDLAKGNIGLMIIWSVLLIINLVR